MRGNSKIGDNFIKRSGRIIKLKKKIINGKPMWLDTSVSGICRDLATLGYREPCFEWIIKKEAYGVSLELGGNIGYHTLVLCDMSDKVITVEPDKRSRQLLKRNIRLNSYDKKVKVYSFAAYDQNGKSEIYYVDKCNLSSLVEPAEKEYSIVKIKTKKIDSLSISPNFIKMDIEGAEIEAIEGMKEILSKPSCNKILIEVHPHLYSEERSFEKTLRFLLDLGFRFKYVVSAGVPVPDLFKEKGYKPFKVMDCGGDFKRGIFKDIATEDAINFCAYEHKQKINAKKTSNKIVRSVMLEKTAIVDTK